jgi:hypothetical protein
MKKINNKLGRQLLEDKIAGIYTSQGAVIDGEEFIVIYDKLNVYLAHISEFEQKGLLIRLKNEIKKRNRK